MKYCVKRVRPDTRPGIRFNEEGVRSEQRKTVDWDSR